MLRYTGFEPAIVPSQGADSLSELMDLNVGQMDVLMNRSVE